MFIGSVLSVLVSTYLEKMEMQSFDTGTSFYKVVFQNAVSAPLNLVSFLVWGREPTKTWQNPHGIAYPYELCCPITQDLFVDPVVFDGLVYEREILAAWFIRTNGTHPINRTHGHTMAEVVFSQRVHDVVHLFAAAHQLVLA